MSEKMKKKINNNNNNEKTKCSLRREWGAVAKARPHKRLFLHIKTGNVNALGIANLWYRHRPIDFLKSKINIQNSL